MKEDMSARRRDKDPLPLVEQLRPLKNNTRPVNPRLVNHTREMMFIKSTPDEEREFKLLPYEHID